MSMNLAQLAKSTRGGWTATDGDLRELRSAAQRLGWSELPNRRGDPSVTELRPRTEQQAKPNSLSTKYGTGAQPLHTDGAHLPRPPDIVALVAKTPSRTPTRLWRTLSITRAVPWEALHNGIFLVSSGRDSFFTPAAGDLGFRYDPGCMTPCDQRARATAEYFTEALEDADEHVWDMPGQILLIDNRRALHARAAVDSDTDAGRTLHRVAFALETWT